MKEFYIKSSGDCSIYCRKSLHKGRKVVVFVHGLSGSSSAWRKFEPFFENEFSLITFDLRGHGKSSKLPKYEDYAFDKYADDLYQILKKEKISKANIISHSFGCLVLFEFLRQHHEMAEKLVFISPDPDPSNRFLAGLFRLFLNLYLLLSRKSPITKKGRHVDYGKYKHAPDWHLPRLIEDIQNTTWRVYLYSMLHEQYVNAYNLLPLLRKVLVMHGEKDSIIPLSHGRDMFEKIKGCEMAVVKNADHVLVLNYQACISAIILDFLKHGPRHGIRYVRCENSAALQALEKS